jgi:hypothetical protein
MGLHYCEVCKKHIPGGEGVTDKDSNDLCYLHGQEYVDRLETRVRELEEGIREHKKEIDKGICNTIDQDVVDWRLWNLLGPTQEVRDEC